MYINNGLEELSEYLVQNIGTLLEAKSLPRLEQYIESIPCPIKYMEIFDSLILEFPEIKFLYKEIQNNDSYVMLDYLVEYYEGNNGLYDTLKDKIYEIRDELWGGFGENILYNENVKAKTIYEVDYQQFPNAITHFEETYYFVFDKATSNRVDEVISEITKENHNIHFVDVINEKFDIYGLCYVPIVEQIRTLRFDSFCQKQKINKNYTWSKIFKKLRELRIPVCLFIDSKNELKLMHTYAIGNRDSNGLEGWREDLRRVFMSSWEANIARILNYKKIRWEYEAYQFELKTHLDKNVTNLGTAGEKIYHYKYRPDFLLSENKIIEVKGFWDNNSLEVVKCFYQEYPHYKQYIIDSDMYYSLESLYSSLLPNWEKVSLKNNKSEILPIVGINRPERIPFVKNLKVNDEVFLERDSENAFDVNAIKVIDKNRNHIGYVSKDWAIVYADKLDLGMKFKSTITSIESKVMKINVSRSNTNDLKVYQFLLPI